MIQQITVELEPAELLPVGTLLHRRYAIDGVLARGTYGIAYLGHDEKTSTRIVIKEYFPYALADRAGENNALMPKNKACGGLFYLGSEMFYRQHLALTDAKGSSNVVTVYTAFFENGTSYAIMEQLEGVTLDRYLRLRGRRLTTGECMFILASMADALLVVHSLNSLHYDITAHSIFLCTDGSVKLIAFGAAKAGLRARREVDDTQPWIDLSALAKTLYEAMTGQAVFQDAIQPNPSIPQPLFHLFWRMIDQTGAQGIASVFDYRHALACIDLQAEYPLVSEQEAHLPIPDARRNAAQAKRTIEEQQPTPEPKRNLFARALDAMEDAVTAEKPEQPASTSQNPPASTNHAKKIGLIYAGVVVGALILALLLRGLIH
jgi:serine/threonine protein kinase